MSATSRPKFAQAREGKARLNLKQGSRMFFLVVSIDAVSLNNLLNVRDLSIFASTTAISTNDLSHKQKILVVELIRDLTLGRLPKYISVMEALPYLQSAQFACPKRTGYLLRDAGGKSAGSILND